MKNIDLYNLAIMAGRKWVATPFAINYGYEGHGYEDDYVTSELDGHGSYDDYNWFGKSKKEVYELIKEIAKGSNIGESIYLGDFREAIFGVSVKEYNTVHIYIKNNKIYIAASYLSNASSEGEKVYADDFIPMYKGELEGDYLDMMISCDYSLFKFTINDYRYGLHLRLLTEYIMMSVSNNSIQQYQGWLRIDEGKDEESNRFEYFSACKTILLSNSLSKQVANHITQLDYSYE